MVAGMGISGAGVDTDALSRLIVDVKTSGGSEIANTQPFVERLCRALALEPPAFSNQQNQQNDYVFERRITFKHPDGSTSPGRIDLYKRGCFVLESKQSSLREAKAHRDQLSLLPEDATQVKLGTARRGTGGWDRAMLAARNQAESYARALPVEHGYPPFLLVLDVGNVLEVYADFSGQGKNYAHFPDRQGYRLAMDDLLLPEVQERLKAIWVDPLSLDPAKRSAEVTRDIAGRLSIIARRLEGKHDPRDVAEFLMRCLFTMFAEDVGLLPGAGFAELLKQLSDRPETFPVALESLWRTMDEGGYEPRMMATLKRFNGSLFKSRRALPLAPEDIHELYVAAMQDWSDVEPAIFGTLLERALDPRERSKLGAHYTPRAYVERLVVPTIIEPLRTDWEIVQAHVDDLKRDGRDAEALQEVRDFHHKLCTTRVLDPACGSGNFLYVSLELMKKLEGEVLEALDGLGDDQTRLLMEGETVGPRQFYGLELNKRAVPIADLVLWIGFLKWQLRTVGQSQIAEPVLHAYGTIRHQDAILAYDREELLRDESGAPVTRWDGVGVKLHPVTGELVPDPEKRVEVYRYVNPRPAEWPEAEFIVGNPPFIGNKRMRDRLGSGYVDALRAAYPKLGAGIDLVMYWWWRASRELSNTARSFGLVTTNSIRQSSNRPVVRAALKEGRRLSFVVPDHPWAEDGAAVRVSMTAVDLEDKPGRLDDVYEELPDVATRARGGYVNERLTIGADLGFALPLVASSNLSFMGVIPVGMGFVLEESDLTRLGIFHGALPPVIRRYQNGRELIEGVQSRYIIDFFGCPRDEAARLYPSLWQHISDTVRPVRSAKTGGSKDNEAYAKEWWLFGKPRPAMRSALSDLTRFIGTTETARHRVFSFLSVDILPDQKIRVVALQGGTELAVVSARTHLLWAERAGGRQGVGNDLVYNNVSCFDPFPFPQPTAAQRSYLSELGERLDLFRKERLAAHDFLTLTSLYNVLERERELDNGADVEPLSDKELAIHEAGLVSVLKEIHDDIDRAVLEAYGWGDLTAPLVGKPGATLPSPHKSPTQEAAEEELLGRLVALNKERAAEEARGVVRWLRPEYQIPRLGKKVAGAGEQIEADLGVAALAVQRPRWPGDAFEQIRQVREVLATAPAPLPVEGIAVAFDGRSTEKRRDRIRQVLSTLVATGAARTAGAAFFVPR